jgi:ribonuclease BN (tRNA processing enzyme)
MRRDDMVTVTFLGTNGWYDSKTGNTVCALIGSKKHFIVLDAGFGIHKLDQYISSKSKRSVSLFLSHFHLDHIVGIHTLNKFKFKQMSIFGPPGTKKALKDLVKPPYTFSIDRDLSFPFKVNELREGKHRVPFPVESKYLLHSTPCMGYRFELDGKTIAYCTDTGLCDGLRKLASGVDLLILECSYLSGERHVEWPHMNPEECGHIAKECDVGKLVLTHFDAGRYRTMVMRDKAGKVARRTFRRTTVAKDGLIFEV